MSVIGTTKEAAGVILLKAAIKQPELVLDLLVKSLENMAGSSSQKSQKLEVPPSAGQGTNIDILV